MSFRTPNDFAEAGRQDPGLLLDALQKQTLERVVPALDRALGRVDDYLFDRSQSGNDDLGLTALRDLRRVRGQLGQRFEQAVIAGFRNLRDPRDGVGAFGERAGLSLLSEDDLEEQLANEQLAGTYTSVFKGQGLAFREVRQYQPGDDVRSIDWNVSARMNETFVKVFVEEREMTVMLVVDLSASEHFGTRRASKARVAAEILADKEWQIGGTAEALSPLLDDAFFLDKKRYVRRRSKKV